MPSLPGPRLDNRSHGTHFKSAPPLKIEPNSEPDLSGPECARRDEEGIQKRLALRGRGGRAQRVEVYELCAEARRSRVEHVVDFDDGAQTHVLREAKLAREGEIEEKGARPEPGVARQVSRLPNGREREGREQRGVERRARSPEAEQ